MNSKQPMVPESAKMPATGQKIAATLPIYLDARLKELAGEAADREGLSLSEFFVRAVAEKLGRPDLVLRKKAGRPRKPLLIPA